MLKKCKLDMQWGKKTAGFREALEYVREGDTIVV